MEIAKVHQCLKKSIPRYDVEQEQEGGLFFSLSEGT